MYMYVYIYTHTHTHTGLCSSIRACGVHSFSPTYFSQAGLFFLHFLGLFLVSFGSLVSLVALFSFSAKVECLFFCLLFVVCVCVRARVYIYKFACVCVCLSVFMCVYLCVCVCVCVTEGFPLLIRRRACTFMLHPPWSGAGGLMWGLGVGCMCLHVALLVVSAVLVWWQLGMCVCGWVLVCGWVRVCLCMRVFARDVCL